MTLLLDWAVSTARALPPDLQDAVARIVLTFVGAELPAGALSEAEAASLGESLAQADRGEFASEERITAIWAKHGL